jgi:peptide deformylase
VNIVEIVKYGNPVLRTKGARINAITDDLKALAAEMLETLQRANGVGLAAQQVGKAIQFAVVDVTGVDDRPSAIRVDGKEQDLAAWMPLYLINPELELGPEKQGGDEGCLSFPAISGSVQRSRVIKVKAMLLDGRNVEFEAEGFVARAIQHETDHLNGILFIDRMSSATKAGLSGKLKRLQRQA